MRIVICVLLFTLMIFFSDPAESFPIRPRGYNLVATNDAKYLCPNGAEIFHNGEGTFIKEAGKPPYKASLWHGEPLNHPKLEKFKKNDYMLDEKMQIVGIVLQDGGEIHETDKPGSMDSNGQILAVPKKNYILKRGKEFIAHYYHGWAPYNLAF